MKPPLFRREAGHHSDLKAARATPSRGSGSVMVTRWGRSSGRWSRGFWRLAFAQALAGEFDPMGVVDHAIEHGIGQRRKADPCPASGQPAPRALHDPERAGVVRRSSTISRRSRACSGNSGSGPRSSRMSRLARARVRARACCSARRRGPAPAPQTGAARGHTGPRGPRGRPCARGRRPANFCPARMAR